MIMYNSSPLHGSLVLPPRDGGDVLGVSGELTTQVPMGIPQADESRR